MLVCGCSIDASQCATNWIIITSEVRRIKFGLGLAAHTLLEGARGQIRKYGGKGGKNGNDI